MTGIERHFKEEREARLLLFQQRLVALRDEFADLDLFYIPAQHGVYSYLMCEPQPIVEVRKARRWSWK